MESQGPVRFPYLQPDFSAHGVGIDLLIIFLHVFMAVLFVGWGVYFVMALWKFRSRAGHKATYSPIKAQASKYIEIGVIVIEVILLFGLSMPIWANFKSIPQAGKSGAGEDAMTVRVVAQQFAWNIHYPGKDGVFGKTSPDKVDEVSNPLGLDDEDKAAFDDFWTINQFIVPVNKGVIVEITSKDVIHSFALHNLRVKQDAVPGLRIPIHFTAVTTGKGEIACAQLCGNSHYKMRGDMEIKTQEDYDKWVAEQTIFNEEGAAEQEFDDAGGGEGAAPASVQTTAPAPAPAAEPAAGQPAAPAESAPARDFGDDGFDN